MFKKLLTLQAICMFVLMSPGSQAQILFTEDFTSAALPLGWTNDSLGQPADHLWVFTNPFARVITGAGFDTNFALFDSDENLTNDSIPELASLTTPLVDITGAGATLFLELDEQFRYLAPPTGDARRHIQYSTDTGNTWTTVVYDSLEYGYPNPAVHSLYNISSALGSAVDIMLRFTWTGDWDWWWAIDNVKIVSYASCTAPPVSGDATASVANICPGIDFDLHLIGADAGPDITYQWQSSPDSIVWTDITGATTINYTVNQIAATYYKCIVTCTGVDSSSTIVFVDMSPGNTCYCVPPGTTCTGTQSHISNVSITGTSLNNNSACDELTDVGYTFWPDNPWSAATLVRGTAYDFSVTTDDDNIISIWIDYDLNGGFEPSEWTQVCTTSTANVANTANILIPVSATMGPTRMRVRSRLVLNQNGAGDACLSFGSGESEDYIVGLDFNVGVQKLALDGTLMYPNPSTGMAYVFFQNTVSSANIHVFDHTGRLVKSQKVSNVFTVNVDLHEQSNGIYFIQIQSPEGFATHKLILNK